jgi:hypothetical protein
MGGLSSYLLGCNHRNTSRPFTTRKKSGASGEQRTVSETYIVCLDCGKKFPYSWEEMKVLRNKRASEDEESPETNGFGRLLARSAEWLGRRYRSA